MVAGVCTTKYLIVSRSWVNPGHIGCHVAAFLSFPCGLGFVPLDMSLSRRQQLSVICRVVVERSQREPTNSAIITTARSSSNV